MAKKSFGSKLREAARFARNLQSPMEVVRLAMPERYRAERVLNDVGRVGGRGRGDVSAVEVVRRLKELRNVLKGEAYVVESGGVDYARLGGSSVYRELEDVSAALRYVDPLDFQTDDERKAFWINLYNVMMIHGVIALGIRASVMEVPSFFSTVAYRVGGVLVTPDEVEHGVLRLNQPGPGRSKRPFGEGDERVGWSPSALDVRLHMALVCVSKGCPPIAFYDPSALDAQLDMASYAFVAGGVEVDDARRVVEVSKIFQFYKGDFGGMEGIWGFMLRYSEDAQREALERAQEGGYGVEYTEYDWSLNAL